MERDGGTVHDLPPAGRLSAWGSAALHGHLSPDDAADGVAGPADPAHRVAGLPDEPLTVTLPYALARLRTLGATGLRLVLPRPGDVAGLPGPPEFNVDALAAGAAVLTTGGCTLALLPVTRAQWSVHRVDPDHRTPLSLRAAERDLSRTIREAAEDLTRLDVAAWDPAAAEVLDRGHRRRPALPASAGGDAHRLLALALRISSVVQVAAEGEGGVVTGTEAGARARVLRDLDDAARHAVEAACSAPEEAA
jgi:hypothetical protein